MTALLDTSFLFALTDQSDRNHQQVLAVAQRANEPLVLPVVVLPEVCYLIDFIKIRTSSHAPFCV